LTIVEWVQQAIEDRRRDHLVAEDLAPAGRRSPPRSLSAGGEPMPATPPRAMD